MAPRPKTPYLGTPQARAASAPTTPVELSWDHEVTPLPDGAIQALQHVDGRVKRASQDQVSALHQVRSEMQDGIKEVDRKVDELAGHVVNLSLSQAEMVGKLDLVLEDRAVDRQAGATIRVESVRSEIKVRETNQIAAIEARRERGKFWRDVALRVFAAIAALWAVVSGLMLSGKC
jgi:hypothetical protein